jgi:hypothetical protein
MTRRKGEITQRITMRWWSHQVALLTEAPRGAENNIPIYALAKELAGEPRRYLLERAGRDFVVFCFGDLAHAQVFAERFGGEVLPVEPPRGPQRRPAG